MSDEELNNIIERAYWNFDARKKGYGEWRLKPQSERDAFKQVLYSALHEVNEADKQSAEISTIVVSMPHSFSTREIFGKAK